MNRRVLIAGVGNVFLGDDGFGVQAVSALEGESLPEGTRAADFGIRGLHLAFELLAGVDWLIVLDAVSRGDAPGTLYVIEPDVEKASAPVEAGAHGMDLSAVFAQVLAMGGELPRLTIIGCEPQSVAERMGLSASVQAAVPRAVLLVKELITLKPAQSSEEVREVGS